MLLFCFPSEASSFVGTIFPLHGRDPPRNKCSRSLQMMLAYEVQQYQMVAPVAYQVILEPGIGQFREFEPRRVHTR